MRKVFADFGIDNAWVPAGEPIAAGGEGVFIISAADFAQLDEPALHYALAEVLTGTKFAIIPETQMINLEDL